MATFIKLPPSLLFLLILGQPFSHSSAQIPINDAINNAMFQIPSFNITIPDPTQIPNPDPNPVPNSDLNPQPPHGRKPKYQRTVHEFLRTHNEVRAKFNVPPLSWDKEIAHHARSWSDQRRGDCALIHSGNPDYGENMFWGAGNEWSACDAVKEWAAEELFYDIMTNLCVEGKMCGHFTQMVWNTTEKVGCGRSECFGGGVIITCNYSPPGNYAGERPY